MKSFVSKTYGRVSIEEATYNNGNRIALLLFDDEGSQLATLTVNIPEQSLQEGEFFIKNYSENEEIAQEALESGLFVDTGRKVRSGWVMIPVWRWKDVEF